MLRSSKYKHVPPVIHVPLLFGYNLQKGKQATRAKVSRESVARQQTFDGMTHVSPSFTDDAE